MSVIHIAAGRLAIRPILNIPKRVQRQEVALPRDRFARPSHLRSRRSFLRTHFGEGRGGGICNQ